MRGSIGRGMRRRSSSGSSQSMVAGSTRRGDGGVGGVGDVERVGAGRGAAREGPGHPGVDRAEAELAPLGPGPLGVDRRRGWPSPWWPTRWGPAGCPRPAGRGRSRPCAGPASRCPARAARPVARSHTMVEARWLAMPTPPTGPPSARAARATVERRRSAMAAASNSTRPGCRGVGEHRGVVRVLDRWHRVGRWRRARPRCRRRRRGRCRPVAAHAPGGGPKGEGRPSLPGLRMPAGSKVCLEPGEDVEARAEGAGRKRERLSPMPW